MGAPGREDQPRDDLVNFLRRARRLLVFTGAGISTDSGIPISGAPRRLAKETAGLFR